MSTSEPSSKENKMRGSLHFVWLFGIKGDTNIMAFQEETCGMDWAHPLKRFKRVSEYLAAVTGV